MIVMKISEPAEWHKTADRTDIFVMSGQRLTESL